MPAAKSLEIGGLPLGLSNNVKLLNDIAEGQGLTWDNVEVNENDPAILVRREMESAFGRPNKSSVAAG